MWQAEWAKSEKGLSSTQALMLMILNAKGPRQAKDLMGALAVSSGGITVISDKLISLGLIRRVKQENDRRAVYLEITESGKALVPSLEADWNGVMDRVFSVLTDVEVAILLQLFTKLVDGKG